MDNSAIVQFGRIIKLNEKNIYAYIKRRREFFYRKRIDFHEFTGVTMLEIITREKVLEEDIIEVDGDEYLVYEAMNYEDGIRNVYTLSQIFKNDFDREIEVYDSWVNATRKSDAGELDENPLYTMKARIRSISGSEQLAVPLEDTILRTTHEVSVYSNLDAVKVIPGQVFVWKDVIDKESGETQTRCVEVIRSENLNQRNKIIVFLACERSPEDIMDEELDDQI